MCIISINSCKFKVATFDVSLFSGCRYPFGWSLTFGGSLLSKGRYFGGSLLSIGRYFPNFTVYCMRKRVCST